MREQKEPTKKNDQKSKELPENAFGNFKAPYEDKDKKAEKPVQRWEGEGGAVPHVEDLKDRVKARLTPQNRGH